MKCQTCQYFQLWVESYSLCSKLNMSQKRLRQKYRTMSEFWAKKFRLLFTLCLCVREQEERESECSMHEPPKCVYALHCSLPIRKCIYNVAKRHSITKSCFEVIFCVSHAFALFTFSMCAMCFFLCVCLCVWVPSKSKCRSNKSAANRRRQMT